jgi:hypothetical protein
MGDFEQSIKSIVEDKKINNETLEQLKQLLEKNPNDKSIKKCIETYEEDLKKQKDDLISCKLHVYKNLTNCIAE